MKKGMKDWRLGMLGLWRGYEGLEGRDAGLKDSM